MPSAPQVIHSDMERTGWFASSHALVDQLHENVVWGLRGNFLYVPTDCPQRDERLGWTGDIQVFAPTASFLYDVRGFLASWLADLELEQQHADGVVPFVVPSVLPGRVSSGRRLGRRRDRRADRAARALRRRAGARRPAGQHAGLDRRDRAALR